MRACGTVGRRSGSGQCCCEPGHTVAHRQPLLTGDAVDLFPVLFPALAADLHAHAPADFVAAPPVLAGRVPYRRHELGCDDPQVLVRHDLDLAPVLRKRVVEGPLLVVQVVARFGGEVLRDLDQLLQDLERVHAPVVVARDGVKEALGERLAPDDVRPGAALDLAVQELLQRLDGEVLVLHPRHLEQERLGEDADVGSVEAAGLQDVHDLG